MCRVCMYSQGDVFVAVDTVVSSLLNRIQVCTARVIVLIFFFEITRSQIVMQHSINV